MSAEPLLHANFAVVIPSTNCWSKLTALGCGLLSQAVDNKGNYRRKLAHFSFKRLVQFQAQAVFIFVKL